MPGELPDWADDPIQPKEYPDWIENYDSDEFDAVNVNGIDSESDVVVISGPTVDGGASYIASTVTAGQLIDIPNDEDES